MEWNGMKERISLRERKKLMSRQKILQTAAVLFKKHSFSEISIADIMKSANLGVGTFYNYFASKEELLLALLKDIAQKVDQCVEDGKKRNLNSLQLLDFASNVMAKLLDENRFVLPLFLSASEHSDKPELLPTRKYTPTFKPIFEQILNQGQLNEEIRTDIPADLIAEMFHSIYQAASFSKLDIPFQKNIQLKVRLLIDGISLTK